MVVAVRYSSASPLPQYVQQFLNAVQVEISSHISLPLSKLDSTLHHHPLNSHYYPTPIVFFKCALLFFSLGIFVKENLQKKVTQETSPNQQTGSTVP